MLGVLAAGLALFGSSSWAEVHRTPDAPPPRVSLTMPPELMRGALAFAKGRVSPPQSGRILIQVKKAQVWRSVAAGKVRHGRFRISFTPQGAFPSQARMRAALMQGQRQVAVSAVDGIRIGPASPPATQPPAPSGTGSQSSTASSGGGQSTPPEETPPPGEEPPPEEPRQVMPTGAPGSAPN